MWTASDASDNSDSDTQEVTVVDTTPPSLSVSADPSVLWPANHKLVTIVVSVAVSDDCDQNPVVRLVSIESNEPDDARGDGHTEPDIVGASLGTDDREFRLRAERSGRGDGRVYTITYSAEDSYGNTVFAQTTVTVPKSQR
jgi:endo-1,4-beta-xylanase